MRRVTSELLTVLLVAALSGFTPLAAGEQPGRRAAQPCTPLVVPPPPVDTSEQPKPGQTAPAPLPVPQTPAGGERMGDCGVILPDRAPPLPPDLTAQSWVIQNLDTGAVLAARDPHARQRPASLIKTLLALVVIKELKPEQIVTVTEEDAAQECTCVGIAAGGKYSVEMLLKGMLMHSGNDVAHALATALGGQETALAKMNTLAAELGATDTRAASTSGLDAPGMTSSAYDLSLIFHYAMRQPQFAAAIATEQLEFPGWGDKPPVPLVNDNRLLGSYPGFLGGKTGFTDDARHTYVGGAARGNTRIAVVLVRAEQQPIRVADQAARLLDYGFGLPQGSKVGQLDTGRDLRKAATNGNGGASNASPEQAASDQPARGNETLVIVLVLMFIGGVLVVMRARQGRTRSR